MALSSSWVEPTPRVNGEKELVSSLREGTSRSSVGATAWSSLRVTPRARIGPTVGAMDFAQLWARYGDRVLVTALAAMYAVELLRWDDARLALAIPLGLAGCFLLLLR